MTLPIQPTPLPPLDPSVAAPQGPESVAPTEGGVRFEDTLAGSAGGPAVDGPAPTQSVGEAAPADGPLGWMNATDEALNAVLQRVVEKGDDLKPHELIGMQMQVHQMSFQIETASKAIEHGMSSTKTLLQTQA